MKRLFIILVTTIITLNIWGAKAYPEPITITQKDGKMLTYRLHGDEHFNYIATTDGVLLYQQGMDFFIAVIDENGNRSSSGVLAHNAGQRTSEEIALIGKQDKDKFFAAVKAQERAASRAMKKIVMPSSNNNHLFPHEGSPTALVILADFADVKFKHNDQITKEIFTHYLNEEVTEENSSATPTHEADASLSRNAGSVVKYFDDMSDGHFTPIFDVAAVVHLSQEMSVYGQDWQGKVHSFSSRMDLFIPEVCQLAHDAGVDFSKPQYDADGDDYVDLVYVIYAGYGQSTGGGEDTIWPQSGTPYVYPTGYSPDPDNNYFCIIDGKKVFRYGVHSELNFNDDVTQNGFNGEGQINGIGLFCHEFSHCMGLPDFYPTTKDAQEALVPAMEFWDLMDGGEYSGHIQITINGNKTTYMTGYSPTAYTAWEREYMGWMNMDVLKNENSGQQIQLVCIDDKSSNGKAYKIFPDDVDTGKEYVFIQNIQQYGWNQWLAKNLGHGMLITYVKYDESAFSLSSNSVNNDITHRRSRMTIVPADGVFISSYDKDPDRKPKYISSHRGDPFPGTSKVHELRSIPMIWGRYDMEKPLLNIQEENDVVTFYYLSEPPKIATDINDVDIVSTPNETRIYTLDGRYLGNSTRGLAKGVYIINGKKTVIR